MISNNLKKRGRCDQEQEEKHQIITRGRIRHHHSFLKLCLPLILTIVATTICSSPCLSFQYHSYQPSPSRITSLIGRPSSSTTTGRREVRQQTTTTTSLPFIATTSDAVTVQEQEQQRKLLLQLPNNVYQYYRNKGSSPSILSAAANAAVLVPVSEDGGILTHPSCLSGVWGGNNNNDWGSCYDSSPGRIIVPTSSSSSASGILSSSVYQQLQQQPRLHKKQLQQQATATTTILDPKLVEIQRRKDEWAKRYTSVEGLRETFGSNKNKLWGDLDAPTARRLYKTLLPAALCELVLDLGVTAEELAPLAYQARKAAKLYARERCHVPARFAAIVYDGLRQWKQYGKFQPGGMSYEQIWDKYYNQWVGAGASEEEIVAKTCRTILEKSCRTNERIDRWLLSSSPSSPKSRGDFIRDAIRVPDKKDWERRKRGDMLLREIAHTLEMDFRKLIDPFSPEEDEEDGSGEDGSDSVTSDKLKGHRKQQQSRPQLTQQQYHALKLFALALRQSKYYVPTKTPATTVTP